MSMEFKCNSIVSTLMLVTIMFAVAVDCRLINGPDYDEDGPNYHQGVPVFAPSRECSIVGGLCVKESDCAQGELTQKRGLCGDSKFGVECCYRVEPKEASCVDFQGVCMAECHFDLRQPFANDCGAQHCCVLVGK